LSFEISKKTQNYSLSNSGYPLFLERYSYASWITDKEDYASTSSWAYLVDGGAVSSPSKKQTCITNCTFAVEFVALVAASEEAEWL